MISLRIAMSREGFVGGSTSRYFSIRSVTAKGFLSVVGANCPGLVFCVGGVGGGAKVVNVHVVGFVIPAKLFPARSSKAVGLMSR